MFFVSLKPIWNVKLRSTNIKTTNILKEVFRQFGSKKDPCKSKPILLNPDCKTAVVTGGLGGIGYATAYQLLCEKAKRVALIGTDTKKGLEAVNCLSSTFGKSKAAFFKCNVKSKTEVEDTMNKIKVEFEGIDIVVNTAGIWNDANWSEEMEVNLGGTINVTLAAKECVNKGNGVVVNITGFSGLEPFPPSPPFAAFASGIINFSRSYGHDVNYKKFGVRVVVLCVGVTQTNILNNLEKRALNKEMSKELSAFLANACCQKSDACAKAVVEIIKFGPPGSVWLVEGSRLFYYNVPEYRNCLNLISQFV